MTLELSTPARFEFGLDVEHWSEFGPQVPGALLSIPAPRRVLLGDVSFLLHKSFLGHKEVGAPCAR